MTTLYRKAGVAALCAAFLAGCSTAPDQPPEEPVAVEQQPGCDCTETATPSGVIGQVEYALVGPDGPLQKARIDTGATTTSLGYHEIQQFERDGKKWVSFSIKDRLDGRIYDFERPLERTTEIKRHGAAPSIRPVVTVRVSIGDVAEDIEVTLADRDGFDYPVLIGRNFLDGKLLVDVSQRYMAGGGTEE